MDLNNKIKQLEEAESKRREEFESKLEEIKQYYNQEESKPKFKVGEVYLRKGHGNKYALTYNRNSVCIINLTNGKEWKTLLKEYIEKDHDERNRGDRSITWSEMQFLTGNKADEFTLYQPEGKKLVMDGEEKRWTVENIDGNWNCVHRPNSNLVTKWCANGYPTLIDLLHYLAGDDLISIHLK